MMLQLPTAATCVLIGEEPLVVRCAETLHRFGHKVISIVTERKSIRAWANEHDIRVLRPSGYEAAVKEDAPDLFVSAANLRIIPADVLAACDLAVNFHDGPLPEYAGLNTPSWAILNGERKHGVTWHCMEPSVDRGAILKKRVFPIASDVTAQILNVMCFEEGVRAFDALISGLSGVGISAVAQSESPRRMYRAADGPPRQGFIDGHQPATQAERLVRATLFGSGTNRFGMARLCLDGIPYEIMRARVTDPTATGVPGTVTQCSDAGIELQASPGRLLIENVSRWDAGTMPAAVLSLRHDVSVGSVLPKLTDAAARGLVERDAFWQQHASDERLPTTLPGTAPHRGSTEAYPRRTEEPAPADPEQSTVTETLSVQVPPTLLDEESATASPEVLGLAAWGLLLSRYTQSDDILFQTLRWDPLCTSDTGQRRTAVREIARFRVDEDESVSSWLAQVRGFVAERNQFDTTADDCIVPPKDNVMTAHVCSDDASQPKVTTRLWLDPALATNGTCVAIDSAGGAQRTLTQAVQLRVDTTLSGDLVELSVAYRPEIVPAQLADQVCKHAAWLMSELITSLAHDASSTLSQISMLDPEERTEILHGWNDTHVPYEPVAIHHLFEDQVQRTPDAPALSFGGRDTSYRHLNDRAERVAQVLVEQGIQPGDRVGVCLERSVDLVASLFGILKTGAAYVPLDPGYPTSRIQFMAADAELRAIVSHSAIDVIRDESGTARIDVDRLPDLVNPYDRPPVHVSADAIAYVIYTSGSTGTPKGVMVTHANVANFFAGMDARVTRHDDRPNVWLSVTSISFDISVMELFWTLARGFHVVLQVEERKRIVSPGFETSVSVSGRSTTPSRSSGHPSNEHSSAGGAVSFSLFYFSSDEKLDRDRGLASKKYQLLLDGAAYADTHGYEAIWTPERHFHDFGGLYPNPSVISAAIAARTENVHIRAGSCVSPLHHAVRIAEDWSVVDNLSGGRVGISFAAGWQPNDFVIRPEQFARRKEVMFEQIDDVRALWRGESRTFVGPDEKPVEVRTLPRPVQEDLPVWVTAAGNPETFRQAGEKGCHMLTHLLGQHLDELTEKIRIYQNAWRDAGHRGEGRVTLMLHTFVGPDQAQVKEVVRAPMKQYLKSSIALIKKAAWSFPTFKQKMIGPGGFSLNDLTPDEADAVLDLAFERYYEQSGFFGTPERCAARVDEIAAAGVTEIACLLDFGIEARTVIDHLPYLTQVKEAAERGARSGRAGEGNARPTADQGPFAGNPGASGDGHTSHLGSVHASVAENIRAYNVTHLQCTPSQARMLVADAETRRALAGIDHLMVGGEAFPPELARDLSALVRGRVTNMYGPTETTIWSSTWDVTGQPETVPIGDPIANTSIVVLDARMRLCPAYVPGDLWIGGDGVTNGYLHREELTADRFVPNPYGSGRLYKTGDLGWYGSDGLLHFGGRSDHQVKLRGHRIELGEIERTIEARPAVEAAVVVVETRPSGDEHLVAYVVLSDDAASGRTASGRTASSAAALPDEIREQLPSIMVPSRFVRVPALPLTPNGKVDRNALSGVAAAENASEGAALQCGDGSLDASGNLSSSALHVARDANHMEVVIGNIWASLLGESRIRPEDNFFEIGGHSLLAVQAVRMLSEETGHAVSVVDLFQHPTLAALATHLQRRQKASGHDGAGASRGQSRAEKRRRLRRR